MSSSASLLKDLLLLKTAPVAITFTDKAPTGIPHVASAELAGCGYWRRAGSGETFYTEAQDHYNCPIGAHTHNVQMPAEVKEQLMGMLGTMASLEYVKMDEVPGIPTRKTAFQFATYSPLDKATATPDVVLVRGNARQMMMLAEAAMAAGCAGGGATLGRPTCAVIPAAINSGATATSFGCIGNRVYTGAGDDEAYYAIPGGKLGAVTEKLTVMVNANRELEKFHRGRLPTV